MAAALTAHLLAQCDADAAQLRAARPLPGPVLAKIRDHLRVTLTYASNAVEGNTLTLQETMVVLEGQTVGGKALREHLEAMDHAAAFDYVWTLATRSDPLALADVRAIHALVTRNTVPDGAGAWRTVGVRSTGSAHRPPDAFQVPLLMAAWVENANAAFADHPIARAATLHRQFVDIHPFLDGNGRTARLLTNLFLVRHGYIPALLVPEDRLTYYQALEAARADDPDPLVRHLATAVHRSFVTFWAPYLPPAPPRPGPRL
jgi:Fic family protein